jgi:hypothetical protein
MKIEYLATRWNREILLYQVDCFLDSGVVVWPDEQDFFTNWFDRGSEFVRISNYGQDKGLFKVVEDQKLILGVSTSYSSGVVEVPGKEQFQFLVEGFDVNTLHGNILEEIKFDLALIKNEIYNGGIIQ